MIIEVNQEALKDLSMADLIGLVRVFNNHRKKYKKCGLKKIAEEYKWKTEVVVSEFKLRVDNIFPSEV